MQVDAGSQKGIHFIFAQLFALEFIQLAHQLQVEAAGEAGAVGHGESDGAAIHADAAGAVRAAAHWNAVGEQGVCDAAESAGCAGGDLGGTHALAADDAAQLFIGELAHKFLQRHLPVSHVAQLPALIPGIGEFLRQTFFPTFLGIYCTQGDFLFTRQVSAGSCGFPGLRRSKGTTGAMASSSCSSTSSGRLVSNTQAALLTSVPR